MSTSTIPVNMPVHEFLKMAKGKTGAEIIAALADRNVKKELPDQKEKETQ